MSFHYQLYSYFRSSCSYRVRIGLHWKGVPFETVPIHLIQDGGKQNHEVYKKLNPISEVPSLEILDLEGHSQYVLSQSMAILEYLEEAHPTPSLLPSHPIQKAKVRQLAEIVNSSIQPIQNLRVMNRLKEKFNASTEETFAWNHYWIERGFQGLERILCETAGTYSFGNEVSLADLFLVPQHYNAVRFGVDLEQMPTIQRIVGACSLLPAFKAAHPDGQPDTPQ